MNLPEIQAEEVKQLIDVQKAFFNTHATRSLEFRVNALKKLKENLMTLEGEFFGALKQDLAKPEQEAYVTEFSGLYHSIDMFVKNLKKWAKPKKVSTPIYQYGKSKIYYEPYGCVLIIAPFNYPVMLAIEPLIGAIIAGNTAIVKPSELTPHVAKVIEKLIHMSFPPEYVTCVQGGIPATTALLANRFDYIFFTGSVKVGKIVMRAASQHLTPVTLELGGKSPVIIDETADISACAQRLVWGKWLNNGQTCIAPDYVLVQASQKAALLDAIQAKILEFYGSNIQQSPDYGRIVSRLHAERLAGIIQKDQEHIVFGGQADVANKYISPTILDIPRESMADTSVMQEEIFGPLLPVISVDSLDDAIDVVRGYEKPLALYVFSRHEGNKQRILRELSSGNVSINDTIKHIANPHLPFGGVGDAGMGNYHGKFSLQTFSHQKGVYENTLPFDFNWLFPPFSAKKMAWIKRFF